MIIGDTVLNKIYLGDTEVEKIYLGDDLVYDGGGKDYSQEYLTFDIISGGTLNFTIDYYTTPTINYSINGGEWISHTIQRDVNAPISLNSGDIIQFKGNGYSLEYVLMSASTIVYNAYGNLYSIVDGSNFQTITTIPNVQGVFSNNGGLGLFSYSKIVDASNMYIPETNINIRQSRSNYYGLFSNCTSLIKSPSVPKACNYAQMFKGCSNLSYIKCLSDYIPTGSYGSTSNWVQGVAATGTFVKAAGVEWPSGNNGIPNGWTIIEE